MIRFVKRVLGSPFLSSFYSLGIALILVFTTPFLGKRAVADIVTLISLLTVPFLMFIAMGYQAAHGDKVAARTSFYMSLGTTIVGGFLMMTILGSLPPPLEWHSRAKAKLPNGLGTITFQDANACPPGLMSICHAWRVRINTSSNNSYLVDLGKTWHPQSGLGVYLINDDSRKIIRLHHGRKDTYFDLGRGRTVSDVYKDGERFGTFAMHQFAPEYARPKVSQLYHPFVAAVDRKGNVYVVDRATGLLAKYTANGSFITKWQLYNDDIAHPFDHHYYKLAVGPDEHVWAAPWWPGHNVLSEYSASGKLLRILGTDDRSTAAQTKGSVSYGNGVQSPPQETFFDVAGIEVDDDRNVYVETATDKGSLLKISPSGRVIWKVSTEKVKDCHDLSGISVTPSGQVLVKKTKNGVGRHSDDEVRWKMSKVDNGGTYGDAPPFIEKYDSRGKLLLMWKPDVDPHCEGINYSAGNGCIYVADPGNHRVLKYTDTGKLIPNWGR